MDRLRALVALQVPPVTRLDPRHPRRACCSIELARGAVARRSRSSASRSRAGTTGTRLWGVACVLVAWALAHRVPVEPADDRAGRAARRARVSTWRSSSPRRSSSWGTRTSRSAIRVNDGRGDVHQRRLVGRRGRGPEDARRVPRRAHAPRHSSRPRGGPWRSFSRGTRKEGRSRTNRPEPFFDGRPSATGLGCPSGSVWLIVAVPGALLFWFWRTGAGEDRRMEKPARTTMSPSEGGPPPRGGLRAAMGTVVLLSDNAGRVHGRRHQRRLEAVRRKRRARLRRGGGGRHQSGDPTPAGEAMLDFVLYPGEVYVSRLERGEAMWESAMPRSKTPTIRGASADRWERWRDRSSAIGPCSGSHA